MIKELDISNEFSENVTLALRLIDKMMGFPAGEQLYQKEIQMLFRLIEVVESPPLLVKTTKPSKGVK